MESSIDLREYMGTFIEEAKEMLESLDMGILQLERNPDDKNTINEIFRTAHSMKGMAATMGFNNMAKLTHNMEDILHDIREDKIKPDKKLIDLLFICHDYLIGVLEDITATGEEKAETGFTEIIDRLHDVLEERVPKKKAKASQLIIEQDELGQVRKKLKKTENIFKVTATLSKDCILKYARCFMALNAVKDKGVVIKSEPSEDDLSSEKFTADISALTFYIVTASPQEKIREVVLDVSEVSEVQIENFTKKGKTHEEKIVELQETGIVDSIIISGQAVNSVSEITMGFEKEFRDEILAECNSLEDEIISLNDESIRVKALKKLFRGFHSIKGMASLINNTILEAIAERTENIIDRLRKGIIPFDERFVPLLLNSLDYIRAILNNNSILKNKDFKASLERHLEILKTAHFNEAEGKKSLALPEVSRIGTILMETGALSPDDVVDIMIKQKEQYPDLKFGEIAVKENKVDQKDISDALYAQKSKGAETAQSYLRVPALKLDNLIDMIGELMIIQSQIEQEASRTYMSNDGFFNNLVRISRIIKDVQNLSMSLRMISLQATFQKINRVARDTIAELKKDVEIEMHGEETEIDRGIADKLVEPLMHMIKNSISHGIELAGERVESGKRERGKIIVRAYNKRGSVYIDIEDDGKGLNTSKIYKKAVEKGIVDETIAYTDEEITNFIFLPGFSTAEVVDKISGRGVGLDVVRTEITRVGGKIEINNKPGMGCTFTLKIPINMAAMNGTIVDINGGKYIIPTLYIKEIVTPLENNWISVMGKETMIRLRDSIIPVISIKKVFGFEEELRKSVVIVLEMENKYKALPVRSILGRSEIVVKSMEREFGDINYIAGASILGDGNVSLILDIENIFKVV